MRRLRWLLPLLALALAAPALWRATPLARSPLAEDAARRALAEGNRRVRDGDLEAAAGAYAAGWSEAAAAGRAGETAGVLAYNLGTVLHRLGRRPEALLWYRRAATLRPADRWLADNLALVRGELAAPRPPPGPAALLAARRGPLAAAAVAAAWASLGLLVLGRTLARRAAEPPRAARAADGAALALGVAALLAWLTPAAASFAAPRPAVLLAGCGEPDAGAAAAGEATGAEPPPRAANGGGPPVTRRATLPPGTEVWVRPAAGGAWNVAGAPGLVCPGPAVALVDVQDSGAFLLP